MGYTFTGDSSFYRLTLPEMRILHAGYRVENQLREDKENGVSPGDRQGLSRFAQQIEDGTWTDELNRTTDTHTA